MKAFFFFFFFFLKNIFGQRNAANNEDHPYFGFEFVIGSEVAYSFHKTKIKTCHLGYMTNLAVLDPYEYYLDDALLRTTPYLDN